MSDICIFSRAFYPAVGGLERIAQILATEASKLGHKVEVVTDTPALSEADDQQFQFKITRSSEYQARLLAFRRADAVLFMNVSLHGMRAAFAAGSPIVFSHHGIYRGRGLVGKLLELLKRQLTWFYPNISVSQFVARNIPARSIVIPNAYDSNLFQLPAKTERDRDFVFCGRLVSDKGADNCIRAFSIALKNLPESTLTIVGDGPERQALEYLTQSLGISGQVTFTGTLRGEALAGELQRHACMVVPSLVEEGFGIIALEGIACCDSVIVTQRGGLPEAVGNCGLIVEPAVEEMATAMQLVVKARRSGLALPGGASETARKEHLARHTPKSVAQQYLNVIEQLVSQKAKRGPK